MRAFLVSGSAVAKSVRAGLGKPNAVTMIPISLRNGLKRHNTQMTPNTLKSMWARAVLFAETLATEAAMLDVIVVPMFSPSTIAAAIVKGM